MNVEGLPAEGMFWMVFNLVGATKHWGLGHTSLNPAMNPLLIKHMDHMHSCFSAILPEKKRKGRQRHNNDHQVQCADGFAQATCCHRSQCGLWSARLSDWSAITGGTFAFLWQYFLLLFFLFLYSFFFFEKKGANLLFGECPWQLEYRGERGNHSVWFQEFFSLTWAIRVQPV